MTYPHIEKESKTVKLNVPDYLTPEHQQRVIDVNNAVMETVLVCGPNRDCLNCGNEECLKVFEQQAKLWGMTLHDMFKQLKQQQEEDIKAAEEQKRRYAEYERRENYRTALRKNMEEAEKVGGRTGGGLFDMGRAA